jgi:hypothetical protein
MNTHIWHNESPRFKELALARYGSVFTASSEWNEEPRYLLENTTNKAIFGYVIKWTPTGDSKSPPRFVVTDALDLMTKSSASELGKGIPPHATRFITQFINVSEGDASREPIQILGKQRRMSEMQAKELFGVRSPEPTLDLVVYEDGSVEGPDEQRFSELMVANRQAKHDAGVWVLRMQREGKSPDEIASRLRNLQDSSRTMVEDAAKERYLGLLGRYSSQLLAIRDALGEAAFTRHAQKYASMPKLVFTRQVSRP